MEDCQVCSCRRNVWTVWAPLALTAALTHRTHLSQKPGAAEDEWIDSNELRGIQTVLLALSSSACCMCQKFTVLFAKYMTAGAQTIKMTYARWPSKVKTALAESWALIRPTRRSCMRKPLSHLQATCFLPLNAAATVLFVHCNRTQWNITERMNMTQIWRLPGL